jgi:hypothetical protein
VANLIRALLGIEYFKDPLGKLSEPEGDVEIVVYDLIKIHNL